MPATNLPAVLISVVTLIVPEVIVPTALKVEMLVKVLLEVAVIFPAVVAVVAVVAVDAFPVRLPVTFPVTFPDKAAVIVPAEKLPLASLFTIVLTVLLFVAAAIVVLIVPIVEALTPPTLFTVGKLAVPAKSPANCIIPFAEVDASDGAAVVVQVKVPLPVVLNTCPLVPCVIG